MYFFKFTYWVIYKAFYIYFKKKQQVKFGENLLRKLEQEHNGKFDERTFKKIIFGYSIQIPAIYDGFLGLYNRKSSQQECTNLLHYFICSSVFDNFFDRQELTDKEIYAITFDSQNFSPKSFEQRIGLAAHLYLLSNINPNEKQEYLTVLKRAFDVQAASRNQFNSTISNQEIDWITREKGGCALQLCCYYLDKVNSIEEKKTWYALGEVIQFTNDLYDIYRDIQNGLETIPNRLENIIEFKSMFLNLINNLKNEINNITVHSANKLPLKISLMGIAAFGIIAIEQLEKIADKNGNLPNLKTVPRKQLIVDMEKPSMLIKWVNITYKLSKK
ncbi:MAG: hypothetical protein ACOVMM_03780 [Chitinophagaceae bacterium]